MKPNFLSPRLAIYLMKVDKERVLRGNAATLLLPNPLPDDRNIAFLNFSIRHIQP